MTPLHYSIGGSAAERGRFSRRVRATVTVSPRGTPHTLRGNVNGGCSPLGAGGQASFTAVLARPGSAAGTPMRNGLGVVLCAERSRPNPARWEEDGSYLR